VPVQTLFAVLETEAGATASRPAAAAPAKPEPPKSPSAAAPRPPPRAQTRVSKAAAPFGTSPSNEAQRRRRWWCSDR